MTPAELEAIRSRAGRALDYWRDPVDGERAGADRDSLLAHVDALTAQLREQCQRYNRILDAAREREEQARRASFDVRCQAASARHLLTHQQARGIEREDLFERVLESRDRNRAENLRLREEQKAHDETKDKLLKVLARLRDTQETLGLAQEALRKQSRTWI